MPGLTSCDHWHLWRYIGGGEEEDPLNAAALAPSGLSAPRAEQTGVITVRGCDQIMIRAFGTDAENDTFGLQVAGYCENGPGEFLLDLNCILGAQAFPESFLPAPEAGSIPLATEFFEADTYAEGEDQADGAIVGPGTAVVTAHYEFSTHSYPYLLMRIIDAAGQGEATSVGVIWRPKTFVQR
jgi:hypothetical protein